MKALKILIVMLVLIMSVGAVCAADNMADDAMGDDSKEILETVQEDITTDDSTDILKTTQNDIYTASEDSFTNLTDEIKSKDVVDLTHDYKFNNETDDSRGIVIGKDNFVLNGNGHTIDGNDQARLLYITGTNITLNDLILINGNYPNCAGICAIGTALTLNNVTFINNHGDDQGGAIGIRDGTTLICNNSRFIDNYAKDGPSILVADKESELKLYNSYITSKNSVKGAQIFLTPNTESYIENTTFANITSSYAPAIYGKGIKVSIIRSKFINLKANITAGAIGAREGGELYIENCEFENVTSSKNGGAIFADVSGSEDSTGNVTIIGTKFKDTYSEFGGAYVQLGGDFVLKNTEFINSQAMYNGGAIYLSYTNTEIDNCTFDSNGVSIFEGYPTYGGAIFNDMSTLKITYSKFFNNNASAGSAIYAYDSSYDIRNSVFENNTNPIYSVFDKQINISRSNVFVNDDNISTNNTYYSSIIIGEGLQLVLLNNTINTTIIPDKFDLRDYGWVSSIKNQGWMGACWTFGMTGTLESAMLKAANITTDFSENNMQNTMIKYSIYGCTGAGEGGSNTLSTAYLLSWLGAFTQDVDAYDEIGKISPVITTLNDIHIQDVMFTPNNEIPNGTQLKLAIMKYGSIDVSFYGQATAEEVNPYYNPETYSHYVDEPLSPTHAVSIIGWDDDYNASNFLVAPPGNGAWIVKNSYGTEWGDNGFFYISYYDKTLLQSTDVTKYATSIIVENTVPYNKNYQHAILWGGDFVGNGTVSYMNVFEALDDDLIAAVGTYFNQSDINYTVEIYVNDELKLTQEGVSPYYGYHTIKLNNYIPIKEGDVFKAVITSNSMPRIEIKDSRLHYTDNISFISFDGKTWQDAYDLGYIACLKVYTVADSNKSNTFTALEKLINASGQYLTLGDDYAFYNETDDSSGILIGKDNFVLNGNGHIVDGKNLSRIFNITGKNITINDLVLINGNAEKGGAIYTTGSLTLSNVNFLNNYAKTEGGAVGLYSDVTIVCDNSRFIDNYAEAGSAIYIKKGELNLYNAELSSKIFNKYSQIAALTNSTLYIENSTFANTTSSYSPALYVRGSKTSIINSKFINLNGNITAGAIGIRLGGEVYIENCEFINTTSSKNAGAVYADIAGDGNGGNVTILDSIFKDTYSDFGGAFLQLGGDLFLNNTEFINNHATYNGGSVYLSCVNGKINNCTFTSNSVDVIEGYPTYGGAILLDMGTYNISKSKFFNNNASAGAAIYAYDSAYTISNSIFENNTNPIYSVFDKQSNIDESNTFINDNNISTNNTFYATIIVGEGMQLTLINNTINVTTLPSRYDSRDWGWVSSVKAQGWMGSCWTFGMTGALESALLKATGLKIDLSENNMQDTMIKYSIYGETEMVEGAINTLAASYLLSWFGAFTEDLDSYDEMGKISPVITTTQDIHVQDVIFIANDEVPNGTKLKEAIMKYGSINVNYYGQSQYDEVSLYYNTETYAQYVDVPTPQNHAVTVVGWDDNFPKEKFLSTPPGDGAWIVKNSWGPAWGENGYLYVSYYDQSFVQCGPGELNGHATAVILENTVPYNKNYQYVVAWDGSFLPGAETVSYMNVFEALDDDLIAAVGTFFQEGGDNYTVEIYVNDELKLTQNGVTPYIGYHTIKLNEYIPVKEGDVFKAVITTKNIPFMKLENMRTHYTSNISFVSIDGAPWIDSYYEGVIAVLKVYTVDEDVKQNTTLVAPNRTIGVNDAIYGYDYQFILKDENGTALANKEVQVSFNGKNQTVTTDEKGWGTARVKADTEGTYDVEITFEGDNDYNGISQSATIKLIRQKTSFVAPDRTVYVRDMSGGYSYSAILKDNYGKPLANKKVLFIFNGEKQVAFTDENGWATVKLTADTAGTQTVTIKFAGDRCYQETAITKTIKIVRESSKMTVPETTYKTTDAKQVTATLKSKSENLVYGAKVTITVDGKTYDATTDSNGIAKFNIDINKLGIFDIVAKFDDSRFYAATTTTSKINII